VSTRPAVKKQSVSVRVVSAADPVSGRYLLVDPSASAPGATLTVRGGGFAPGRPLHLTLNAPGLEPWPVASLAAGADGTFQANLTLPLTVTASAATLQAGGGGKSSTSATVLLRSALPVAGISPNVVTPGQHVSVWVANMRPGETVRVYAGRTTSQPIFSATAGADGRGSWPLSVPFGPGGPNQLVVIGDEGRAPVVASYLLLNLYPHASVSSYAPQPGKSIVFYGGGFAPGEPVELYLDRPLGRVLATATANKGGGLPRLGPYVVPFGLSGTHTFLLRGKDSHAMAAVGVLVEPFFVSARPSTYAAGPGTVITFYGSGFAPLEIVRVYLITTSNAPGQEVAALRTTAAGKLVGGSGSYAVPTSIHGNTVRFTLVGDISGATAQTTVQYLAPQGPATFQSPAYHPPARQHATNTVKAGPTTPVLIATPPRVVVGGRVGLWGSGFAAYTWVHLVLTSAANPAGWDVGSVRTTVDGIVNTTITVPAWALHADAVRAYAGKGDATSSAHTELEVGPPTPQVKPATYSGAVGTPYSISGEGFTPGEEVGLYFDSIATLPLAVTIAGGGHITFDAVHVPLAAAGSHTFLVKGARGEIAAAPFTVYGLTPYILLSTYSSQPEVPVTVTGQGFVAGETVHLFTGDAGGIFLGGATADNTGALNATSAFTIPTTARGPLTVVAVGDTSGHPVRATIKVQPFGPSLWLSSYAGHPGSTVAFTGTGFARDDVLHVYIGDATTPAATFRAHDGAFAGAGTVTIAWGTKAGMLPLTLRGALSDTAITLRYLVVAYTPGAGFEIRHQHGYTRLRLGAGGFAPHETVRYYRGEHADGTPFLVLHANAQGNLPLLPVLTVKGTPHVRLAYTLVGTRTGTRATALYVPPHSRQAGR
jgi:hypothetical protein